MAAAEIGYALPNAWEQARLRLGLLEACHDPTTFRRADALGVGPGWQCLDVGAGYGSVARWLAARVQPGGSVIAADLDTRLLEELERPGLKVRQMDVVTDELPTAAYDFVHTRVVLMHIPERDAVLEKLVAALAPDGVLMIEEDDIYPVSALADGAYGEAWHAFATTMQTAGVDPEWARGLPGRLEALDLADVGAELDSELFRGGSAPARLWSLTWLQLRERIVEMGYRGEVVDEGRAALADPTRWFFGPAKIIAWGRRRG
jgi:SAM-dependent methyltransferase